MQKNRHHVVFLGLLCGALIVYSLGSGQAYRSDEVWSLRTVSLSYPAMMEEIRGDIHPPLHYWLLRCWIGLVGTGEVAVRALSILLCLVAAVAVYVAGREWLGSRGALVAGALFIASPIGLVAAQLVRMYGLLALTAAVSTLGFLRLSRNGKTGSFDWAIYVAANIAGSFTHIWFFFLLFAQGCTYLVFRRTERFGRMTAAAAASLLPYGVMWLPVLLRQSARTSSALAWVPRPGPSDVGNAVFLLCGPFLLCVPFLAFSWKHPRASPMAAALPGLVALVTILVPLALSFMKPIFWPRFTIVALPALCLSAAAFAPAVPRYRFETGLVMAWCAVAAILSFYGSRCDSRSTAEYLARNTREGDVVVFTSLSRLPIDYYWDRLQPRRRVHERSFPAEIDTHPGFEGAIHTEGYRAGLKQEAARLTAEVREYPGARVFFLHGFHPQTDAIVKERFDEQLHTIPSLTKKCESVGSYFQYLSAYACSPTKVVAADEHP